MGALKSSSPHFAMYRDNRLGRTQAWVPWARLFIAVNQIFIDGHHLSFYTVISHQRKLKIAG